MFKVKLFIFLWVNPTNLIYIYPIIFPLYLLPHLQWLLMIFSRTTITIRILIVVAHPYPMIFTKWYQNIPINPCVLLLFTLVYWFHWLVITLRLDLVFETEVAIETLGLCLPLDLPRALTTPRKNEGHIFDEEIVWISCDFMGFHGDKLPDRLLEFINCHKLIDRLRL